MHSIQWGQQSDNRNFSGHIGHPEHRIDHCIGLLKRTILKLTTFDLEKESFEHIRRIFHSVSYAKFISHEFR